jgi:hypothetical protein
MIDYRMENRGSVSDISRYFPLSRCSTSNDKNSDKAEIATALYLGSRAYPFYYLVVAWSRVAGA